MVSFIDIILYACILIDDRMFDKDI